MQHPTIDDARFEDLPPAVLAMHDEDASHEMSTTATLRVLNGHEPEWLRTR